MSFSIRDGGGLFSKVNVLNFIFIKEKSQFGWATFHKIISKFVAGDELQNIVKFLVIDPFPFLRHLNRILRTAWQT